MDSDQINEFRKKLDEDKGLGNKRGVLVITSVVLIAMCLGDAALKEANTFIFRIEFGSPEKLKYLLAAAIIFLLIRYYAYAQKYHDALYESWTQKMLSDYHVFGISYDHEEVTGLLGKIVDVYPPERPGIEEPKYKSGAIFKRYISYSRSEHHEEYGTVYITERIKLWKFSKNWTLGDFTKLLGYELKYQFDALVRQREYLDVLYPYILGVASLLCLAYKIWPKF